MAEEIEELLAQLETESFTFLIIDIVKYSNIKDEGQLIIVSLLTSILKELVNGNKYKVYIKAKFSTGDGAVICFKNSLKAFQFAKDLFIKIGKDSFNLIKIRLGINCGNVYVYDDLNGNLNVAGNAINVTQRILDSGDVNHFLISNQIYDQIKSSSFTKGFTFDPYIIKDKHNFNHVIYNVYNESIGNKSKPTIRDEA